MNRELEAIENAISELYQWTLRVAEMEQYDGRKKIQDLAELLDYLGPALREHYMALRARRELKQWLPVLGLSADGLRQSYVSQALYLTEERTELRFSRYIDQLLGYAVVRPPLLMSEELTPFCARMRKLGALMMEAGIILPEGYFEKIATDEDIAKLPKRVKK